MQGRCDMTDGELVQALLAGDREVFGELVDRHRDMVLGLCLRVADNRSDAEELAHDTFVEAYLKIGTLREPDKLGGWLRAIALNLCRMWYRRRRATLRELPDDVPAGEADTEDADLLARMSAGLWQLSGPQRLVLVLHYFERMSYDQVAEFLDVPIGTVMSRLHRARAALREVLEGSTGDEEVPVVEDDRFREEVQAEIAVLLEMFGRDRGAAERLTVILQHSPQRLAHLIEQTEDPQTLANLAILLPRLGAGAMDAAVHAAFSPDPRAAAHAGEVLRGLVNRCRSAAEHGWEPGTPCRSAYVLLDRLIVHAADPATRVELLVDLLDACQDEGVAALVTSVLLCYPEAAFDLLMEWFKAAAVRDDLYRSSYRLFALCRMGTRFCGQLAELLHTPDQGRQMVALAGADAVGRCLDLRWLQGATPQQLDFEVRRRAKWPPLRSEDLDPAGLTAMVDRTADLLVHPRAEVRSAALEALGHLRAVAHLKQIIPHAVGDEPTTRQAAVRALAEIGDPGAAGVLMHVAKGPDGAGVRRAAVEALGRMKVREAQDMLIHLLEDPDAQIQEAAVIALGELGTPAARTALQDVLASSGKRLRKAASRALFGAHQARSALPIQPPGQQTQSQRIRGDARPLAYTSIAGVLRVALPEIRPYEELDLTGRIAAVCFDYAMTRRRLVDEGWMTREAGTYELTEAGRAAWRVEQFIAAHYLK
jgi:RNA polymerase sigma-70 factor (ECF subfamily)